LTTDGAGVETTAVVVAVPTTVCGAVPADAWKLVSPAYAALIVYAPCAGKVAMQVAVVMVPRVFTVTEAHSGIDGPPPSV
jgi:hypothetical protein